MKKRILNIALALTVIISASSFTNIELEKKEIKTTESKVTWKGYKVTGSHYGSIALKSGHFMFDGDKLTGGEFVIDMTTVSSDDLTGKSKANFDGHMKSEQFFNVAENPTSSLTITKVKSNGKNSYAVTADLTIKGKTKKINFDLSIYGSKATGALKIDRTDYGLTYGSGSFFDNLGDKTIYDEFDLVVDLEF